MITAPALWVALLAAAPPQADIEACHELTYEPTAYYVAYGKQVYPRRVNAWQCVQVVEVKKPKPKKRSRRRR